MSMYKEELKKGFREKEKRAEVRLLVNEFQDFDNPDQERTLIVHLTKMLLQKEAKQDITKDEEFQLENCLENFVDSRYSNHEEHNESLIQSDYTNRPFQ